MKTFFVDMRIQATAMVTVKLLAESKEEALQSLRNDPVNQWQFEGDDFLNIADWSSDDDPDELSEDDLREATE
jgi:hypothetical protein